MQGRLSAIRKPSSRPFIPPVSGVQQGFNFRQDRQANVPPVFKMGSAKPAQQEKHVHFQTETEADVNTTFEPKDKTGWYYSELGERWYKTRELMEK